MKRLTRKKSACERPAADKHALAFFLIFFFISMHFTEIDLDVILSLIELDIY